MNKQISNKITFFILIVVLSLSLYFIYGETYGNVWKVRQEYNNILELSESGKNYTFELEMMQVRLKEVNALIGEDKLSGGSIQHNLLTELQSKSEELAIKIEEVPAPHIFTMNNFLVTTGVFTLSGNYIDLLKVIAYLENDFPFASLSSCYFNVEENYFNKSSKLYLTIYLQNISPNE
jgi:hypothetical protein